MRVVGYATTEEREAARPELAEHLAAGGLVAYPTETVYGLGCTLNAAALAALSAFKGRRPFLLLIRGPEDARALRWTPAARRLAEAFWPGPLTLALTAEGEDYPAEVVGPDRGVAVRVSPHPAIPALLDAAGGPVTSTSANEPGSPPARDGKAAAAVAVLAGEQGGEIVVLDGGRLPEARPSTIVRCGERTRLLREGAVPRSELERVVSLE